VGEFAEEAWFYTLNILATKIRREKFRNLCLLIDDGNASKMNSFFFNFHIHPSCELMMFGFDRRDHKVKRSAIQQQYIEVEQKPAGGKREQSPQSEGMAEMFGEV
jgi:hypothetical protein